MMREPKTAPCWWPKLAAVVLVAVGAVAWALGPARAQSPAPLPGITSLANPKVRYRVPKKPYVVMERGLIRAVVVDNSAVNDEVLPNHRAGYHGIAHLSHEKRPQNLFVPFYSGLNFEHIHDGTVQSRAALFEPRVDPMQLRVVDRYTVELYQKPTRHWKLESCHRYELLPDGTIQMTMECIPRAKAYRYGYIGLFWASYIHRPESKAIHFWGYSPQENHPHWITATTPSHGVNAVHRARGDQRQFEHQSGFPLPLVFGFSSYRYEEPWYYGVSHGMALLFVFRPQDQVRLTQSPTGGGRTNPAWDFQGFIKPYEVGKLYRLVMRAVYVPYRSPEQMRRLAQKHMKQLAQLP